MKLRTCPKRAGLAAAFFLGLSCSPEDDSRPPAGGFGVPGPIGIGDGGAGGGSGASGGTVSSAGGEPHHEIKGRFSTYLDDFFVDTQSYIERSELHVLDEDRMDYQTLSYDGIFFSTDEVRNEASVWILVEPQFDNGVFPTLAAHDTTEDELNFVLVPRYVVDTMMASLSMPTAVNDVAAQLIVRVVDENDNPIEGVSAALSGAEAPLYFDLGVWTEFATETDSTGYSFFYNLAARQLPGRTTEVLVSGEKSGRFAVPLVSGALTVATLMLD